MWHTPRFPGRTLFSPTCSRLSAHRRRSAVFRLERLEERTVLSLLVNTGADSGLGSLRQAIADAAPGDTITFDKNVHRITLTTGELDIAKNLDIEGPGPNKLKISGNDSSRVFDILSGTVTIAGLTITDGLADKDSPDEPSLGGGILNSGVLTLSEVIVSDCRAIGDASANPQFNGKDLGSGFAAGGGVYNAPTLTGGTPTGGTLTVSDSTFTRNQAQGGSDSTGPSEGYPPNGIFPGSAIGGGLANYGVATVTRIVSSPAIWPRLVMVIAGKKPCSPESAVAAPSQTLPSFPLPPLALTSPSLPSAAAASRTTRPSAATTTNPFASRALLSAAAFTATVFRSAPC